MTMDDGRLERAIQAGPPDRAAYRPLGAVGLIDPPSRRPARAWPLQAAAVVALGVLVLGVLTLGQSIRPRDPAAAVPAGLRAAGRIQVLVPAGSPQAFVGGSYQGFDFDLARALGRSLRLDVQIDVLPTGTAPSSAWDVAIDLPAVVKPGTSPIGAPTLWRSSVVVVRSDSPITNLGGLTGQPVCVVAGSIAGQWLAGGPVDRREPPPPGARPLDRPDVRACLDAVRSGEAVAFVADWAFDVGAPGEALRALSDRPFVTSAGVVVNPEAPEASGLERATLAALSDLREGGTLTSLSIARFGSDLSVPPSP